MRGSLSRRAFLGGAEPPPEMAVSGGGSGAFDEAVSGTTIVAAVGQGCLAARGVYCRSCAESCEAAALRIRPRPAGRAEVAIDPDRCTACAECLGVCPVDALSLVEREHDDA